MVKIYVKRIKDRVMTLEEVPIKWKSEVEDELKKEGVI